MLCMTFNFNLIKHILVSIHIKNCPALSESEKLSDNQKLSYLVFKFVYLRKDNINDAAQHYDKVESVPRIAEVVLEKIFSI